MIEQVDGNIGESFMNKKVVLRGICPFCNAFVSFRQIHEKIHSDRIANNVPICCESCKSISTYSINQHMLYPSPEIKGLTGLPPDIQKYYDRALKCLSVEVPDGAGTMFRKIIHALGIHYKVSKKNDDKKIYEIINDLHKKELIVKKLKDALLGVKDIGNDGAHINENEPDIKQAKAVKGLIEAVLKSTVIADSHLDFVEKERSKKTNE